MTNFPITNLDQVSIGTYGYIVKLDTTNLASYDIEFIQAFGVIAASGSAPSDASIPVKTLVTYLESSDCPDLAFNYTHGMCTIFLKTSVWPYVVDTEIAIFGKRNAFKMVDSQDKADFPDELIELFSAYVIKFASLLKSKPTPADVNRTIMREEYIIKNA